MVDGSSQKLLLFLGGFWMVDASSQKLLLFLGGWTVDASSEKLPLAPAPTIVVAEAVPAQGRGRRKRKRKMTLPFSPKATIGKMILNVWRWYSAPPPPRRPGHAASRFALGDEKWCMDGACPAHPFSLSPAPPTPPHPDPSRPGWLSAGPVQGPSGIQEGDGVPPFGGGITRGGKVATIDSFAQT